MNKIKLVQKGNDLPLTTSVETAGILFAENPLKNGRRRRMAKEESSLSDEKQT